jgi:hypothetical protein
MAAVAKFDVGASGHLRRPAGSRCKMVARWFYKRLQRSHFSHARHILNLSSEKLFGLLNR